MKKKLRVALAQLNFIVGDIKGNVAKQIAAAIQARDHLQADLIVFSELSLTGYPPEDLLFRSEFIAAVNEGLSTLKNEVKDIHLVIGYPQLMNGKLYNACSIIFNGNILATHTKHHLPNYGVFDEQRYFASGNKHTVVCIKDISLGLLICEDLWHPEPLQQAKAHGAHLIISPNASPFETTKHTMRIAMLSQRARENNLPIIYVNQVGGQDELVFDGDSMAIDANGEVVQHAGFFTENIVTVEVDPGLYQLHSHFALTHWEPPSLLESVYQALVLSLRDYVRKNHFEKVVLGLSGGIDSALTLILAVDALGKENVHALIMPSPYTALISTEEALNLAKQLGIRADIISIDSMYQSFLMAFPEAADKNQVNITAQNLQARCRGVLLMAFSNQYGHLLLSTGNRSELAVGYCTLYGDMAGGFALLKDIPKTMVYELVRYRNQLHPIIPQPIIDRPPTAELAPNQTDQDSLPPYPMLDAILEYYLNQNKSSEELVKLGYEATVVKQVIALVKRNEYKRRQAALGPHINYKSFGKDWRYPVTNGFKG